MNSKRVALIGVALVSALALISATQQWLTLTLVQGAAAVDSLVLSGQEMNPTLSPIAVAGLAAALALTIAGRIFRYVLGVLLIAFGAGLLLISSAIISDPLQSAGTAVSEITGITGSAQQNLLSATQLSAWPVITLVAGAILGLLGLVVIVVSHGWAKGGRKYESGSSSTGSSELSSGTTTNASGTHKVTQSTPDRISDWEMLSEGTDPSDGSENGPDASSQ